MDLIFEFTKVIELLKAIMESPWLLLFFALFFLGYALKEFTSLNNKLIPWVLIFAGIALALLLLEVSWPAAIVGMIIAIFIMGSYEVLKCNFEYFTKNPIRLIKKE